MNIILEIERRSIGKFSSKLGNCKLFFFFNYKFIFYQSEKEKQTKTINNLELELSKVKSQMEDLQAQNELMSAQHKAEVEIIMSQHKDEVQAAQGCSDKIFDITI